MAQENTQRLRHARPRGPRSNWVPLGVATAVVAVLTGGSALANASLPEAEPLHAGQTMTLGSGGDYEASITFDEGWELNPGSSSLNQQFLFVKGPVKLHVSMVEPSEKATAPELWEGMRDIVRVSSATASLSDPRPVTSDGGAEGLTGDLNIQRYTGTATVFTSPDQEFAVQAQAVGADAGPTDLADAQRLLQSVRFDQASGSAS